MRLRLLLLLPSYFADSLMLGLRIGELTLGVRIPVEFPIRSGGGGHIDSFLELEQWFQSLN